MKPQKGAVELLIFLEVIAFIAVLVFGIVHGGRAAVQSNNRVPTSQNDRPLFTDTENGSDTPAVNPIEETLQPAVFSAEVEEKISSMTLEEKIAQMFFITPEALTHTDAVNVAGRGTKAALETYPVGGLIYSSGNFQGREQTASMLNGVQEYSSSRIGLPMFLGVAEIGGEENSPLASANRFSIHPSPASLGEAGDAEAAAVETGGIAQYLAEEAFNVNFAPIADLAYGTDAQADAKTYGSDAETAAQMIQGSIDAYHSNGIETVTGTFPGKGMGSSLTKDWAEWEENDRLSYQAAIDAGSGFFMIGNVTCEALTGDTVTPCSLSGRTVSYLRNDMGYTGVIITDSLSEAVITDSYSSGEAAVAAVKAGANMLYCPQNFEEAYSAVLDAVNAGKIDAEMIDQSAGYIITQKFAMANGGQE